MFYKETGQFKSKYKEELAAFPLFEDKIGIGILGVLTFLVIPLFGLPGLNYEFAMGAIMIPCMIFIIMTLGLNILLGFAGQISIKVAMEVMEGGSWKDFYLLFEERFDVGLLVYSVWV